MPERNRPAGGTEPLLRCERISAGYARDAPVLRELTLSLRPGELTAVVGPNGSGKTTLIRALTGALPLRSGSVWTGGRNVAALDSRERARRIAVISQRPAPLAGLTVLETVLMGRYARLGWHGFYGREDRLAAAQAMAETGISHLSGRDAGTLSGGEWQRVLVARALCQGSPVLLLDEPSSGLDPARLLDVFDLLQSRLAGGSAVLAVLHDLNLAALYAGRLAGLRDGSILFDGPPERVFTASNLERLYDIPVSIFPHPVLGVPQACFIPRRARSPVRPAGTASDPRDASFAGRSSPVLRGTGVDRPG